MVFKLTFNTLVVLFLVMVIAGRDDGTDAESVAVAQADMQPSALVVPAKLASTDDQPAAVITPLVRKNVMPGPALKPSPEYPQALADATKLQGDLRRVSSNTLNVRSGPSTANGKVETLTRGEEVLIVATEGDWVKIRIEGDGVEGWVAAKFLSR